MEDKKKKLGRPKKEDDNKRSYHMQRTLLTKETKEKLKYYAKKTGLTESDIVRLGLNAYFRKMDKKDL